MNRQEKIKKLHEEIWALEREEEKENQTKIKGVKPEAKAFIKKIKQLRLKLDFTGQKEAINQIAQDKLKALAALEALEKEING